MAWTPSAQLSLNTSLSFSFTFGIDTTQDALGDSFFVNIGNLTLGVSLAANNLDLGLHAGFIDAAVVNGSINLNASLGLQFNNPSGGGPGGNITLNGLQGTNLAGLISICTAYRLPDRNFACDHEPLPYHGLAGDHAFGHRSLQWCAP